MTFIPPADEDDADGVEQPTQEELRAALDGVPVGVAQGSTARIRVARRTVIDGART